MRIEKALERVDISLVDCLDDCDREGFVLFDIHAWTTWPPWPTRRLCIDSPYQALYPNEIHALQAYTPWDSCSNLAATPLTVSHSCGQM